MLRMRQICLVAEDLDLVEGHLRGVFDLDVCFRDPGVGRFGLHNFLMPVGNSFLEVVSPTRPGTAGGRYLQRRGGDGGYMVIMQCSDIAARREHVASLGIRLVMDSPGEKSDGIQLHPKDLPGAIAELRWNHGDDHPAGPWQPAGTTGCRIAAPTRSAHSRPPNCRAAIPTRWRRGGRRCCSVRSSPIRTGGRPSRWTMRTSASRRRRTGAATVWAALTCALRTAGASSRPRGSTTWRYRTTSSK